MTETPSTDDSQFHHAVVSVEQTLEKLKRCSVEEKERLKHDLHAMQSMLEKLTDGRVDVQG
mgnify:FL=1